MTATSFHEALYVSQWSCWEASLSLFANEENGTQKTSVDGLVTQICNFGSQYLSLGYINSGNVLMISLLIDVCFFF